ncbi:MAG: MerR family transcriptional regulator [Chloroflexi bacterium]|nr:MerR family transcriptional regulator [Chloroflexota bacterium]MDQ3513322.1 MerR family transcriptional regulator [Chloroflexota bacterium]
MTSRYGEPVFVISVAARLVEMHPQTLRKYEREGLVAPSRTMGKMRLYSDQDIERLRQVKYLVEQRGLNLAGVQLALELTARLRDLRHRIVADPTVPANASVARHLQRELDEQLAVLGFVEQVTVEQTGT